MESTINRKEYRRETKDEDIYARRRVERMELPTNNLRFFSKIVNVMFLLLDVLLIKFFGYGEAFDKIKDMINSGISLEEIKTSFINYQEKAPSFNDDVFNTLTEDKKELPSETESMPEETDKEQPTKVEEPLTIPEQIKNEYSIQRPITGVVTSAFGIRVSDNPAISPYHTGIDISASKGTPILAAHDGTVIQVGKNGNYGNSITIQNGSLITLYGHCDSYCVKNGEQVKIGQEIGQVGMTGNATGPHLHFEIKYDGDLIDPQEVL